MKYDINREIGKVVGVTRINEDGSCVGFLKYAHPSLWLEFVAWNASQPVPLDLSDLPPDPPSTADVARSNAAMAIKAFKAKPKASRSAQDRADLLDAVADLLGA